MRVPYACACWESRKNIKKHKVQNHLALSFSPRFKKIFIVFLFKPGSLINIGNLI